MTQYAVKTTVTHHAILLIEAEDPQDAHQKAWELCSKGARARASIFVDVPIEAKEEEDE